MAVHRTRQEEKQLRREERLAREAQEAARNRVLVGLPERLEKSNAALREHERMLEQLRQLYGQRLLLRDSEVLDLIGEQLGCPKIEGDKVTARAASVVSRQDGVHCSSCGKVL